MTSLPARSMLRHEDCKERPARQAPPVLHREKALHYKRLSTLVLVTMLLAGCADLSTVGRRTAIPPADAASGAAGGGLAIHLDASQRLFVQLGDRFCAEPMPDALQSLAASQGVGANVNDRVSAAVSNAFSANSASIGLHTQSTTLMRDQYYRICELAANTKMSGPQVAQLMERAQRFTLGILAVEQLTGAVVGQQAALTGDGNATSASSLGATAAALSQAQSILAQKKTVAAAAAAAASAASAVAAASDAKAKADASLQSKADADDAAANQAAQDAKTASSDQDDAQATVDTLKKNLGTATANAAAGASGSATLSPSVTHSNIDAATAQEIAAATTKIVQTLVSRGDLVDSCLAIALDDKADEFFGAHSVMKEACLNAFQSAVKTAAANGNVAFKELVHVNLDPAAQPQRQPNGKPGEKKAKKAKPSAGP